MQNRIVFVTGRKGCGKTTVSNALANEAYQAGRRVIVVAPMGGFDLAGSPTVFSRDEMLSDQTFGRSFVVNPPDDQTAIDAIRLAYGVGNCVLVVDEIDLYGDVRSPDESLLKVIRYGRHRGVSLIGVSQRPANVVRDLTAQSDILIMFHTTENRDVLYLADRIGSDNAERLRSIPQFSYLVYSAQDGGIIPASLSSILN